MSNRQTPIVPDSLSKARHRFAQYRKRNRPRTRLPEELWSMAVEVAREYGVNATARALRLDYYALKKRLEAAPDPGKAASDFIEISPVGMSSPGTECTVEVEDGNGARMRIELKGDEMPDLGALTRAFRGEKA